MPPKVTKRWVPVKGSGEALSSSGHSRGGGGKVDLAVDRLSALPDALLHHIMSFMKAWDTVRMSVLSWRWRDLWASAPCVDVHVATYSESPQDFAKFVYRLLLSREALASIDTLRLGSPSEDDEDFDNSDVKMWIRHAIKRNARAIQLTGHPSLYAELDPMDFISRHLKILKLAYTEFFDSFTMQLSSGRLSLEELELKYYLVECREIASVSLRRLTMFKCKIAKNFSVDAPNLVFLQCITPETWVPVFKNFGALEIGNVMLDDSLLSNEFKKYQGDVDGYAQTRNENHDNNRSYATNKFVLDSYDSDEIMSDDSNFSDDFYDEHYDEIKNGYDYGSDINSDTDTYEYNEIVNAYEAMKFGNHYIGFDPTKGSKDQGCSAKHIINDYKEFGGQNVLHSLSNAKKLELLGHSGEVVMRRESINCPTFSNLKTLALGEWCISTSADFDILLRLLQHSPSLEKLYLHLEMNHDIHKALGGGIKPKGGSFACKHLSMVKIRCTKDDPRVHMLAQLFRSNGLPLEKIYVRRSGSFCLRYLEVESNIAIDELREYKSRFSSS